MSPLSAVYRRELRAYVATPLAAVFVVLFLALSAAFAFYLGGLYERGQADLQPFFTFHPWLYLLLVPALAMRLWAEERKAGTLELLLTLPVTVWQAALAKFLAAWTVLVAALVLTVPLWITVSWLGDPDHGVIVASYLGSALMAGFLLAIGMLASALTRSQVVAFVLAVVACLLLLLAGFPLVLDAFSSWAPAALVQAVAQLSVLTHYQSIMRGVLDLRDLLYFVAGILVMLQATVWILEGKKA